MKTKPVVGQTLFCVKYGYRKTDEIETFPIIVVSVGRKYFMASKSGQADRTAVQFELSQWSEVTDFSPRYHLYPDEQHYRDEQEHDRLYEEIRVAFQYHHASNDVPLSVMRQIGELVRQHIPKMQS